jgi:CRP/FNR family transcriptional regulator/CRP/FNR family cyclic AMP-dependent transcriptional regulator
MIEVIKRLPIFKSLGEKELSIIAERAIRKRFSKESIIVQEDDRGDSLMVILSGRVKVVLHSEEGKEIILSILKDGDFFGEMSLLDGEPRSATVIAMEDSTLLIIQRNDFLYQIEKNPSIAKAILAEMSRRMRRADERIGNLILLDVYGRIARFLLDLARTEGTKVEGGVMIEKRPTQQDIASIVGTSRETVSRVLNELNRRKLISISGKSITVFGTEEIFDDELAAKLVNKGIEI